MMTAKVQSLASRSAGFLRRNTLPPSFNVGAGRSVTSRSAFCVPSLQRGFRASQTCSTETFLTRRKFSSCGMMKMLPDRFDDFWRWTTRDHEEHKRWSRGWFLDALIKCTVFAITGTTSVTLVRPALAKCGVQGSLKDGPNSYRVLSLTVVSPIYTVILLTIGTVAGRHNFFANVAQRMWRRFLPQRWVDKMLCPPATRKK
ncbi:unnamed protein product [Amoebophrya sp. A25]|nr:unnamed protein product [Amoebophrya sp. A25]|eukprot:GSA25T00019458001.1